MPLTSHVVSLDLALALRDAGYPQKPYIYKWFLVDGKRHVLLNHDEFMRFKDFENSLLGQAVAPLASELGEVLPVECEFYKTAKTTVAHKKGMYCCRYYGDTNHPEYADTEADARARMWLHLRKASLI